MSPARARSVIRIGAPLACAAFAPRVALACAVCGGGNPANRVAFFATTVLLSLLPLGMFMGGFLWLRSRLRASLADEFLDRDALPALPPAGRAPLPATGAPTTR
jgi:hypothetical protein